ncbi:MAG: DUF6514 family protein [Defluviitaleaceae bacterium]|nr:DUF6514 family protein [Defluviitaleaceae bacterium]
MHGKTELVARVQSPPTDDGTRWELSYYVTAYKSESTKEYYGLRAEKASEGKILDQEETPAFTESHDEAVTMAKAFADGTVTPFTLLEMTDEWLSVPALIPI